MSSALSSVPRRVMAAVRGGVGGVGCDVASVGRFAAILGGDAGRRERWERRVLHADEREELRQLRATHTVERAAEWVAARWAAKEALKKALGDVHAVTASEICVARREGEAPTLRMEVPWPPGMARAHLSLAHDGGVALAFVVVEKGSGASASREFC